MSWCCPDCNSENIGDNPSGGRGSIVCYNCGYFGMHGHNRDDDSHCEDCLPDYPCPCGCNNSPRAG